MYWGGSVLFVHPVLEFLQSISKNRIDLSIKSLLGKPVKFNLTAKMNVFHEHFLGFFAHIRMFRNVFSEFINYFSFAISFESIPENLGSSMEKMWQVSFKQPETKILSIILFPGCHHYVLSYLEHETVRNFYPWYVVTCLIKIFWSGSKSKRPDQNFVPAEIGRHK